MHPFNDRRQFVARQTFIDCARIGGFPVAAQGDASLGARGVPLRNRELMRGRREESTLLDTPRKPVLDA
ncbi:hypothetical protein [Pseudomonas sp. SCB32]|uniref:hypothetical protein n=1 Tax=Pseudomonas sp. SCB32 TaxID=2653853 RepID=UPI00126593BB|nr:hypothetical protein [Pseudomonas sp. SCB32]